MGAVVQVNDNRHGKAALAQTSFGGFVPKGGSSNDSGAGFGALGEAWLPKLVGEMASSSSY